MNVTDRLAAAAEIMRVANAEYEAIPWWRMIKKLRERERLYDLRNILVRCM